MDTHYLHWLKSTGLLFQSAFCQPCKFTTGEMVPMEGSIKMVKCQKQKGYKDCGVYAITFATSLDFDLHPTKQAFRQDVMRSHLVNCFNKNPCHHFLASNRTNNSSNLHQQ